MPRLRKVLVANRGEIAVRVMRTCRELGIATVAVYSEVDRTAPHVLFSDEAYPIGPAPSRESYLRIDRILDATRRSGADAVHPGYGFLSENAAFARACGEAGVVFVGPTPVAMEAMGEKTRARANMLRAGVPIVPGSSRPLADEQEAATAAEAVGYPVMIKAAGGGGGKGMRRVDTPDQLGAAWRAARSEALSAFGNGAVYIEKYLDEPHHVEVQVFADAHGRCVSLGERECSAQRRHQKVIEETPSPIVTPALRREMAEVAVRAALAVDYRGAGTVEFLVDKQRRFYFLEMNTRLQVEHPVTEWVTGLDLVAWQLRVAEGERLPSHPPPEPHGHAIEARIYAEDPAQGFLPSPGKVLGLKLPDGPFVRNDCGIRAGFTVPTEYDPMLGKLSVWAPTRAEAVARLVRALGEYRVQGVVTNLRYLSAALQHPIFVSGDYDTGFLSREHGRLSAVGGAELDDVAMIAAAIHAQLRTEARALGAAPETTARVASGWRQFPTRAWTRP